MITYFIKTVFRSFKRFKRNFFINILGLSVAFSCIVLIALWVKDEYSVDKFHDNEPRIYQAMLNYKNGDEVYTFEWTPAPLSKAVADNISQVEHATNVYTFRSEGIITDAQNTNVRTNEVYAGRDFFDIFSFPFIYGEKDNALNNPKNVAISEDLAQRIFGDASKAIGETVTFEQQGLSDIYKVSGVFKSVPNNSTLQFNAVFSFETLLIKQPKFNSWEANEPLTFVLLNDTKNIKALNSQFTELLAKNSPAENKPSVFLRPFSDKYLYNTYENGLQSGGRISYINLFSIIALFILVIAAINFVNLSTAQSVNRLKEIGVKQVLGIRRKDLVVQFIGESVIITVLALLVSIGMVTVILPEFNDLVNKDISLKFSLYDAVIMLGSTVIVGVISGLYPAFYLSGFKTIKLLKGKFLAKGKELKIRQTLVVFQFTVSVFLIIAVIVTNNQIDLVNNKELGYDKDQIIHFKIDGALENNLETFINDIKNISGVLNATNLYLDHLTDNSTGTKNVIWNGKSNLNEVEFKYILANYDFSELLHIKTLEGRSFSKSFGAEDDKIIINETALSQMNLENPIGKTVKIWNEDTQIIGVVKDFHFQSLYEKIQPLFIRVSDRGSDIMIKLEAGTESGAIDKINEVYKTYNYGLAMDFKFLDASFQKLYQSERRVAALSKYFGIIAISLSCLGLFGLVTFDVGRRRKEIGVRKVLGANTVNVLATLSKDFLKLVVVAIIIAIPMAWVAMNNWLQDFAYRIEVHWSVFVIAGSLAILIALTTISIQAMKVAVANPVNSLRSE